MVGGLAELIRLRAENESLRAPDAGGVPGQRARAGAIRPVDQGVVVYLQNWHLLPENRLAELFQDLHGVELCAATLANMTRVAADGWRVCGERIRDLLVAADGTKLLDESGFRITVRGQWLHVLSTRWVTFYRTSERRGSLLEGLRGCSVHDHGKPYFTVPDMRHALRITCANCKR